MIAEVGKTIEIIIKNNNEIVIPFMIDIAMTIHIKSLLHRLDKLEVINVSKIEFFLSLSYKLLNSFDFSYLDSPIFGFAQSVCIR